MKPCAPGRIRTRDPLLRRYRWSVAGRRLASLYEPVTSSYCRRLSEGVARRLSLLVHLLAPRNLVSFANVRIDENISDCTLPRRVACEAGHSSRNAGSSRAAACARSVNATAGAEHLLAVPPRGRLAERGGLAGPDHLGRPPGLASRAAGSPGSTARVTACAAAGLTPRLTHRVDRTTVVVGLVPAASAAGSGTGHDHQMVHACGARIDHASSVTKQPIKIRNEKRT